MTALATTADLALWLQMDESALPAGAPSALEMVSDIVRAEARQSFVRTTTTFTTYALDGYVHLPQRPIVSVDSVTYEGGAQVDWKPFNDRLYVGYQTEPLTVTFTHGYSAVPGDVKAVVLAATARVLGNPHDLRQETVGSVSVTYAAETIGASLSPADKDMLARYRRRIAVTRLV